MSNWAVEGYIDTRGRNLIQEYIVGLPSLDRARVVQAIDLLADYGPMLRMPHARHLQGKVWELRIDGRPNSYRVLYAAVPGRKFVLLHVFAKKSRETPQREIDTARRRLVDYLEE